MNREVRVAGTGSARQKYIPPPWLDGRVEQETYIRWLQRKAAAHARRDRNRGNGEATIAKYKQASHRAVERSKGLDAYTGEKLHWESISKYDNDESKKRRREYKRRFALLPTVDHIGDGSGAAAFVICAWRTNDAKSDLSLREFVALCRRVVDHQTSVRRKPAR